MGKIIASILFTFLAGVTLEAQQQHPDSVINQVYRALTSDQAAIPNNVDELLIGPEWEALAYWDKKSEKKLENMFEAVGDVYQFQPTSFTIKLRNPQNPNEFQSAITGTFIREKNRIILKSQAGNHMELLIMFLDEHYLVLELEGMRLFFTKIK